MNSLCLSRINKDLKEIMKSPLNGIGIVSLDDDSYLNRIFEYVKKFYEEQDGEALKASIDSFLNK